MTKLLTILSILVLFISPVLADEVTEDDTDFNITVSYRDDSLRFSDDVTLEKEVEEPSFIKSANASNPVFQNVNNAIGINYNIPVYVYKLVGHHNNGSDIEWYCLSNSRSLQISYFDSSTYKLYFSNNYYSPSSFQALYFFRSKDLALEYTPSVLVPSRAVNTISWNPYTNQLITVLPDLDSRQDVLTFLLEDDSNLEGSSYDSIGGRFYAFRYSTSSASDNGYGDRAYNSFELYYVETLYDNSFNYDNYMLYLHSLQLFFIIFEVFCVKSGVFKR